MHLIHVLVPRFDPNALHFGKGLWKDDLGKVDQDKMIIFEVMAESLYRKW